MIKVKSKKSRIQKIKTKRRKTTCNTRLRVIQKLKTKKRKNNIN